MSNNSFVFPPVSELGNESDVEQKLIYPFITAPLPFGLSYPPSSIFTKMNVKGWEIGKGTTKKSYFPDYVLTAGTLPRVVIEAKKPSDELGEAFREARLYAAEINARFESGLNPLHYVIACNGKELLFGFYDQESPVESVNLESSGIANASISQIIETLRFDKLTANSEKLILSIKPKLYKPRRMLGGLGIQNEEVGLNTFGARIQGEFLNIFNPATMEDRAFIVKNAYVPSKRRERYVEPIDRVIRAAAPPSHIDSQLLEDTSNPQEIVKRLAQLKPLENKILLLIGTVGAGKTTFLDYLQTVALPNEILDKTVWVRINMNAAPMSPDEIYSWLRNEVSSQCMASLPDIDFTELASIEKLYSVEVNQFNKGPGKLFKTDQTTYNIKFAELLQNLQADEKATAVAATRFCVSERGKLLIIALDNSDKRTLDEQLLMFEAAQWLQKEFRCLIMLPLREETYDNYRDRPPLDTALKDLVFRIEPPLFQNVLIKRIQLALKLLNSDESKRHLSYDLPNGFRVEYGANELSYYLTSVVKSIFEHDKYIRRLITGLAGRNIRRALEIFIEFCTSGHIGEDQILKIKRAEGAYSIPLEIVTRVLLRTNRRLYDSDYSYIRNVFGANWSDEDPNHFIRLLILRWLFNNISEVGPSGLKGYFPISEIKMIAVHFGIVEHAFDREIAYLLKAYCIVSETYKLENIEDCELVRLAPAGMVHLDLMVNVDYLAAVAEDTYFDNEEVARQIADSLRKSDRKLSRGQALENAIQLVEFLARERSRRLKISSIISSETFYGDLINLAESMEAVRATRNSILGENWDVAITKYLEGTTHQGIIVNPHPIHGLFVELDDGVTGLIAKNTLDLSEITDSEYSNLAELSVIVEIKKVSPERGRVALRLVSFVD